METYLDNHFQAIATAALIIGGGILLSSSMRRSGNKTKIVALSLLGSISCGLLKDSSSIRDRVHHYLEEKNGTTVAEVFRIAANLTRTDNEIQWNSSFEKREMIQVNEEDLSGFGGFGWGIRPDGNRLFIGFACCCNDQFEVRTIYEDPGNKGGVKLGVSVEVSNCNRFGKMIDPSDPKFGGPDSLESDVLIKQFETLVKGGEVVLALNPMRLAKNSTDCLPKKARPSSGCGIQCSDSNETRIHELNKHLRFNEEGTLQKVFSAAGRVWLTPCNKISWKDSFQNDAKIKVDHEELKKLKGFAWGINPEGRSFFAFSYWCDNLLESGTIYEDRGNKNGVRFVPHFEVSNCNKFGEMEASAQDSGILLDQFTNLTRCETITLCNNHTMRLANSEGDFVINDEL